VARAALVCKRLSYLISVMCRDRPQLRARQFAKPAACSASKAAGRVGEIIRQKRDAVGSTFVANDRMHWRGGRRQCTSRACDTAARARRGRPCAGADGGTRCSRLGRNRTSGLDKPKRAGRAAGLKLLGVGRARPPRSTHPRFSLAAATSPPPDRLGDRGWLSRRWHAARDACRA
jgi:hypothetical protein